jgi:ATPase subunit of ABC transporter with duplicated ATPase domains
MISVRNVTLRRGVNVVLDSASVTFTPGEKIGLVGRNGAGKSSFFGLLNGTLHEDSGEFSIPAAWKMGQVAQEMPETEQGATDFVVEGDTVLLAAQAEVAVKRHKVDREIDLKSSHRQIRERTILKNRYLSTRCRIIDVKSSHLAGRLTPSMTTF